jgi:PAS domain S-box-containing protein
MEDARFRALVENAPDGIVVSRDGIVLYANAAAARLLGHADVSEMIGKPMVFLDRRSVEVMRRRIQQMASTGEALVPREYPARRKDGTEIVAEIASTIIELDGQPAVLAYARDVTERTRLREQLAHADRLASLGTMAAGVAHEINNPLSFVGLAADMLAQRARPEDAPLVAEVRAAIDRIAAIVRDLRFFGRGDDETVGPVDVGAAVAAAERLVAHEFRPRGAIVKELGELPAVQGAQRHLEQVFVNLFLNAAHAMSPERGGRVVVRSRVAPEHVFVTVTDDGGGIPADIIEEIFKPFFTTRSQGGGTGLGLSVCRDLLRRTGGDLVATSKVGEGTTMELKLARFAGAGAAPTPPQAAPEAGPSLRPRVLVVDDEPLVARTLGRVLSDHATVVVETVPERALELLLGDTEFDAVVCDVMMPRLTGADIHEHVARERPGRERRFIFVTGGMYTPRDRDYLERLPNARLPKPFAVADVLAAIHKVCREGR